MKAIERSIVDNGSCERAQHAELIDLEATTLMERNEEFMLVKEVNAQKQLEGRSAGAGQPWDGQGRPGSGFREEGHREG